MWCVYIYITHTHTYIWEYYSAIKKNEILPFATTWMEGIWLSEISRRKTNTALYHLYVESKRKQTSEYNKRENRLTDMENKLVFSSG